MSNTGTGSLLERDYATVEVVFVVTVAMLVFTLGYQLGAVIYGGEFDWLIVLVAASATVATYSAMYANEDDVTG